MYETTGNICKILYIANYVLLFFIKTTIGRHNCIGLRSIVSRVYHVDKLNILKNSHCARI